MCSVFVCQLNAYFHVCDWPYSHIHKYTYFQSSIPAPVSGDNGLAIATSPRHSQVFWRRHLIRDNIKVTALYEPNLQVREIKGRVGSLPRCFKLDTASWERRYSQCPMSSFRWPGDGLPQRAVTHLTTECAVWVASSVALTLYRWIMLWSAPFRGSKTRWDPEVCFLRACQMPRESVDFLLKPLLRRSKCLKGIFREGVWTDVI